MHQVIVDGIEDYLSGNPSRDFRAHLVICEECRQEVAQFEEVSAMFVPLRAPDPVRPAPGFAARVITQVAEQRPESVWSMFLFQPALPRRLAFASLLILAALGGVLVSQETAYPPVAGPEQFITQAADEDEGPADRDRMLVTLTSYQP